MDKLADHNTGASSKSKKKNKKKKGGANKAEEIPTVNGSHDQTEEHDEDSDGNEEPTVRSPLESITSERSLWPNRADAVQKPTVQDDRDDVEDEPPLSPTTAQANGATSHSISSAVALGLSRSRSQQGISPSPPPPSDTSARLDAIAKERDALRQEVTELRKSLESIQEKHEEEISTLQSDLEEANENKDHFETQYKNLLGRVNTIKTSLGDRLKADAVSRIFSTDICPIHCLNKRADSIPG